MTIEDNRQIIIQQLGEVQSLKKRPSFSAMQLHGTMMDRVQRKENLSYQQKLIKKEIALLRDLALIDNFLKIQELELLKLDSQTIIPEPSTSLWTRTPTKIKTRIETKPKIKLRERRLRRR